MPSLSDARYVGKLNCGFLGINMVSQEAWRCTRHRCCWLIPRRCSLPSPDHQSAPSSRFRLDHSLLCLPNPGALAVCKLCSHKPYQASETQTGIRGIRPASERAGLCLMDCFGLLLLLYADSTYSHSTSYTTLIFLPGGMFIPFTFIVADATAHGMSPHLAQYLVCILNATR
jgi:hypothetical protein